MVVNPGGESARARLDAGTEPLAAPRGTAGDELPATLEGPGRQWMLAFQGGDDSAFEKIVLHYRSVVRRFVYRYVQDPDRAEDLAQEAFLRVYRARGRYQPTAGFRTWLFTITTRLCLNHLRSRTRERRVIVPLPRSRHGARDQAGDEEFLDGVADSTQEPAHKALERRELEEAVDRAIAVLPPSQRAALLLLRFEELSYQEIAQTMGTTVTAVKSLINRAREGLRERLGRFLKGGRKHER